MERSDRTRAGAWLLVALLLMAVAAFAVTRSLRSADDVVNSVVLTPRIDAGERATIAFRTTVADADADVLIVDGDEQRVKALQEGEPLAAGAHEFTWDGSADEGGLVDPGHYGIRVVLGEEGRDIVPPGSILVEEPPAIERAVGKLESAGDGY